LKRWYEFRAQARGAEIVIYDEIGAFGIPAKTFLAELRVGINSPGGEPQAMVAEDRHEREGER
jgi:hypothetical protein